MKKDYKFTAALALLLILSNNFPVFAAEMELPHEETEESPSLSDNALAGELSMEDSKESEESDMPLPDEAPLFCANIENTWEGYVVKGTFTEFPDDISHIHTLYSLDGDIWQECSGEWDLRPLGSEAYLSKLQTQICLYDSFEPLKSYLAGSIDRFYLKLRLTLKDGRTYESQSAVIDRGETHPVPEGITLGASFAPSIRVFERNPFRYYGRYQITVSPTATPEDIIAFLPDTLPIEIDFHEGENFVADIIIDCPVSWKSLSLPPLIAGESVTITDAAEEIVVPGGTLLRTPIGVFRLDEPLAVNQDMFSDEIRLVLNVTAGDGNPTGVLCSEHAGLEAAFDLKPTGATAIHAYAYSDQETGWVELPDLRLIDEVNSQPSTANSGYALVLRNDQEPFRSYLAEEAAGNTPTPFIIGMKIEGGVYDGRQLVLPWPDTYELPPNLPKVGGAGGNESNAGSDNKGDSTEEGQRPNLPKRQEEKPESKPSDSAQTPDENQDTSSHDSSQTNRKQNTLPGSIADNGNQQNPEKERTSDMHKGSGQTSVSTQETTAGNNAENAAADPTVSAPTDDHTEFTMLTALPAQATLSTGQTRIYDHNTEAGSYGLLLLMAATATTVICLIVITAKVISKKKFSGEI